MKPTKRRYSVLFFDLDNTLWDFDKNSYFALRNSFKLFGLNINDEEFESVHSIYTCHNERLWELYRNLEIKKNELIKKRFSITFTEAGISGIDPEEFNTVYLNEMPKQTHLIKGATEILDLLFNRYKLYIVTNGFSEVQYKKIENAGLSKYFKKVFISEEIKVPKPNPEFFEYALKSANARKKESLIIGDDWDADIVGASNVGLDQVYYSPENIDFEIIGQATSNKPLTYKINQLSQLSLFL